MARSRGYSSYRGRGSWWKAVLAVLLGLVILLSVAVIFLQDRVVYDEMGVPHLSLPGSQTEQTDHEELLPGDVDITIEEAEEEEEAVVIQAIQLGDDPAVWAEAVGSSEQNAFCVTMKASGGQLRYPFATMVGGQVRAKNAAAAAEVLPQLLVGEKYSIARISCLLDGSVARSNVESMGLKNTGGYIFYDGNNENWLDPSKEATKAYLSALAVECAELGFDEILLTDLTYPTKGKLDKIAYSSVSDSENQIAWNTEQIASLLAAVKTALGDREVKLSLELSESVLENYGVDATAGINLWDTLIARLDRIYVPTTEDRVDALVEETVGQGMLMPELTAVPATTSYKCYLLLNP